MLDSEPLQQLLRCNNSHFHVELVWSARWLCWSVTFCADLCSSWAGFRAPPLALAGLQQCEHDCQNPLWCQGPAVGRPLSRWRDAVVPARCSPLHFRLLKWTSRALCDTTCWGLFSCSLTADAKPVTFTTALKLKRRCVCFCVTGSRDWRTWSQIESFYLFVLWSHVKVWMTHRTISLA